MPTLCEYRAAYSTLAIIYQPRKGQFAAVQRFTDGTGKRRCIVRRNITPAMLTRHIINAVTLSHMDPYSGAAKVQPLARYGLTVLEHCSKFPVMYRAVCETFALEA